MPPTLCARRPARNEAATPPPAGVFPSGQPLGRWSAGQVAEFSVATLQAEVTPASPSIDDRTDIREYFGTREHKRHIRPQILPATKILPANARHAGTGAMWPHH